MQTPAQDASTIAIEEQPKLSLVPKKVLDEIEREHLFNSAEYLAIIAELNSAMEDCLIRAAKLRLVQMAIESKLT